MRLKTQGAPNLHVKFDANVVLIFLGQSDVILFASEIMRGDPKL